MKKIAFHFAILLCFCVHTPAMTQSTSHSNDSLLATLASLEKEAYVDQLLLLAEQQMSIDSAIYYTELAIERATALDYQAGLLQSHYFLGREYDDYSHLDKAMTAYIQAEQLAFNLQDTLMRIKIAYAKGYSLHQMGKSTEGQQSYLQALDLANLIDDQTYKVDIYYGLGELYRIRHDVPEAIKYYSLSEAVSQEVNNQFHLCKIKYAKANVYKIANDTVLVRKGINLLDTLINSGCLSEKDNLRQLSLVHTTKGGMHAHLNEYDKASHHLDISVKYKTILNNPNSLAYSYTEYATMYYRLGKFEKAAHYAELAYQNHDRQDIALRTDVLDNLALCLKDAKDYEKAFFYMHKAYNIRDSLMNHEKTETLAEMEAKYKSKEQEQQLAQQELALLAQKNQMNQMLLWGLLLLSIIGLLSLRYYYQLRDRNLEVRKSKELEQLKGRFLANISHEFRTPISLIIGPLKQWLATAESSTLYADHLEIPKQDIQLMTRNADRLQQLISQLLSLSKLEVNQGQLILQEINLTDHVKGIVKNFSALSNQRQIDLTFTAPEQVIWGSFDQEKISIILNNLLSNAFKFTAQKGKIEVALETKNKAVQIMVSDNGEGISSKHLPHIFNRFYQADDSTTRMHEGSGIGLALTKELVNIHGGQIEAFSELGEGTSFILSFPTQDAMPRESLEKTEILNFRKTVSIEVANHTALLAKAPIMTSNSDSDRITVLIVEDNSDMRQFVKQCLEKQAYQIFEAEDGKMGWQLAKEYLPDLIISDIMMPGLGKDGLTFCKTVKENPLTSHIPIILLTAKANEEDIVIGFDFQADAYIPKPFDPQVLIARVQNLIKQRKHLKIRFAESIKVNLDEIAVASSDQLFIQQITQEIEKQLDNENFGVRELGQVVNMDRTQLFRKLKALIGMSPSQMIKDMRMQRAKYLLENNVANVSQISQMVGYRNPEYFSQSFKKEFGMTPSELMKKEMKK